MRRFRQPWQFQAFLRCAQCGADLDANVGGTDTGILRHGARVLLAESAGQLRQLEKGCWLCIETSGAPEPVLLGDPLDENPAPEQQVREITLNQCDAVLLGEELQRASTMPVFQCVVSRFCSSWGRTFGRSHGL